MNKILHCRRLNHTPTSYTLTWASPSTATRRQNADLSFIERPLDIELFLNVDKRYNFRFIPFLAHDWSFSGRFWQRCPSLFQPWLLALKRERRFSTSREAESGGGGAAFKDTVHPTVTVYLTTSSQYSLHHFRIPNTFNHYISAGIILHINMSSCIWDTKCNVHLLCF